MRTQRLTGAEMRKGMLIGGQEITHIRHGVGSGKIWTFLTMADGSGRRVRRNTVRIEVQIPA